MSVDNERITENLIRDILCDLKYVTSETDTIVEEQKSQITEVIKLLKTASKSGKGGKGSPEFIISSKQFLDFLIIIECKANTKHHESTNRNRPVEFAVDGILHYAKHLSKSFNIMAIAASGQNRSELKISNFLWPKGAITYKKFTNEYNKTIEKIISFDDYVRLSSFTPSIIF